MWKKTLIAGGALVLLGSVVVYFWAQSILATSTVRTALAAQLSRAMGQPVTIDSISASIYPRITVNLGGVGVGNPQRIRIRTLHLGTDLRALMSRQIAHATVRLNGGRIELPLAPAGSSKDRAPAEPVSAPVEIVSVDEIFLKDVEVVSGGRTLRADVEAVPTDKGVTLRRISLAADNATIRGTGQITDMAGPTGELRLSADALDLTRLLAFATAFSSAAGFETTPHPASNPPRQQTTGSSGMKVAISLEAGRAALGTLILDHLVGTARVTDRSMTLDPVGFGVFRGRYDGTMGLTLGGSPDFRLNAKLAGLDVADALTFVGNPGVISGKLAGRIDLGGRGLDGVAIMRSARGTVRVDIRDGIVRNLGLLRAVVIATSMRADSRSPAGGSTDEPFSQLGATLRVADRVATTDDLRFESADLSMTAAGSVRLDGSAVDLKGRIQLSDALSAQAGRDLIRYTQENGRVTLPATVTGSASQLSVGIDVGSAMERALKNRVNEELQKTFKKGLGDFFKK